MSGLIDEFRLALRSLTRTPGFTFLGGAVLALGIGATAAIFCVSHAILVKPLPYADAERLMVGWKEIEGIEGVSGFSIPTYEDLERRHRAFDSVASFMTRELDLSGNTEEPERLKGLMVSAQFPELLGIRPDSGRSLMANDDRPGAQRTVMLSHELWSRRFGSDPEILTRPIQLNGQPYSVVGIYPPGLAGREIGGYFLGDFWVPMGIFRDQLPKDRQQSIGLYFLGRLRPGQSYDDGRDDLDRIAQELKADFPLMDSTRFDARDLPADAVINIRQTLYLLLGAVGFVLVIACSNLASLLLSRGARRQQEFATRMAVGAGRWRLVRQVLVETLLLGALGGLVGLWLARSGVDLLVAELVPSSLQQEGISIGGTVIGFAVVMVLVAVIASGLVPALQASRASFYQSSRSASSRHRLDKALVVLEVALAMVLVIGSLLMMSSVRQLQGLDPGFDPHNVLSAKVSLTEARYPETSRRVDFFDQALAEIRRLPGVRSVAATSSLPMGGHSISSRVAPGGRPLPPTNDLSPTQFQLVSPGFFESMGIPLLAGRDFTHRDDDRYGAVGVAIINQSLADLFWPDPDDSPLGQQVAFEMRGTPAEPEFLWRKVIGVVGDVRQAGLQEDTGSSVYVPYTQPGLWYEDRWPSITLVARTENDPVSLVQALRRTLMKIDPAQPVHSIRSLQEILDDQVAQQRTFLSLLTIFAVVALVLAMAGVYGVAAQAVARGQREIGTRVALGATPSQVVGGLLKQNLRLVAVGLVAGTIVAVIVSGYLSAQLYGVGRLEPLVYFAAVLVLGLAATLAILIPAWQAIRVDPSTALRQD